MEMENDESRPITWEGYVDWRKRPAIRGRHGGMLAASIVLVVEILEHLAFLSNSGNLVIYLLQKMHFSPSEAANNVTNYIGTAYILSLLGGFLSDAFFTTYHIFLSSAFLEFVGLLILVIQARTPSLKPPEECGLRGCKQIHGEQAAMLFIGLYLSALGIGGIKGTLPAHGALQLDESSPEGRKQRSTFFNYYVFCLSFGALIAVTLVVWVEDNKGWAWGLGISTIAILLSMLIFLCGSTIYRNKTPSGSPLTLIFKVLIAAAINSRLKTSPSNAIMNVATSHYTTPQKRKEAEGNFKETMSTNPSPTESLRWLNKALESKPIRPSLECTVQEVEDVKIVLKMFPIFACTIMLNCCVANLSTFSIQQAATMNTKIGSLTVPPASLPVFPLFFIMILAPIFDHFIIPFARKVRKSEMGITHLERIGFGLFLSIAAMAVAALVEIKRKNVAKHAGLLDSTQPLPITFLWIALQYILLGSSDLFTLEGLLEFFFAEAPISMKSLSTSLTWASLSMGFYFSAVIVTILNGISGYSKHKPWLSGNNINRFHLERFYWVMCVLSGLNMAHYLFWACRYKYRSVGSNKQLN